VLRAHRHPHKLRVGQLAGNRFDLRVRGVAEASLPRLRQRLAEIERAGFPNRFGRQRYGRDGDNPEQARALLEGKRRPRDRRHLRFLMSSLQAQVFDAALAERPLALDEVALGEIAQVRASGGLFLVDDAKRENERARRFEISATGPIFGSRPLAPTGAPGLRERELLARFGVEEWIEKARGVRLRGGRRAVRAGLGEPSLSFEDGALRLGFFLAAGSYATVLLEALFGAPVDDAPRVASVPSRSAGDNDRAFAPPAEDGEAIRRTT
jgi:tRNA pseudouridine13 synthase